MKIKSMSLTNFIGFSNVTVNFDDNVTYLVGPNGAGKTTLGLNGIWFVMKGIAEKGNNVLIGERFRFIGDDAASARGIIKLYDEKIGEIVVKRTLTKAGTKLEFIAPEGYMLDQAWLDELFNLYLIAPMRFAQLSPKEQAIALGIDVSSFDKEMKKLKEEYTSINAVYRALQPGEKPLVDENAVDIESLQAEQKSVSIKLNETTLLHNMAKAAIDKIELYEIEIDNLKKKIDYVYKSFENETGYPLSILFIEGLTEDLKRLSQKHSDVTTKVEASIKSQQNIVLLRKWKEETQKKSDYEELLRINKDLQSLAEQHKIDYLRKLKLPFKNLTIDEEGGLLFNNRPIKEPYFSSGELLAIIPRLMASRNPDLKYVYIQQFDLLDQEKQDKLIKDLTEQGFQLVIEKVGRKIERDGNIIILEDMEIISGESEEIDYPEEGEDLSV